ncbi:MAG: replicative DNA helicase [Alphaproteobacteria bacterium]|nr:replicative DNA helicase [Alphaproteobacteria bacterium]
MPNTKEQILYNLDVEHALLGALLLDNTLLDDIPESFDPNYFMSSTNKTIYLAIRSLSNRNIIADPITLSSELNNNEQFKNIDLKQVLISLVNNAIGLSVADYTEIITDFYLRREINKICLNTINECYQSFNDTVAVDIVDNAEQQLYNLSNKHLGGKLVPFHNALYTVIKASKEGLNNRIVLGITSGFNLIDKCLGGFNKSDLIILAGRPSMGKTALAVNIAFNASRAKLYGKKEGTGVIFFSLEMSAEQLATRLLSSATCVPAWDIKKGNINQSNIELFSKFYKEMENIELYIEETPNITSQQIKHKIRKMQLHNDIGLIIIDYLQLMSNDMRTKKDDNRVQEISAITRQLKNIARELDIPIIVLSQLSRAVEQRDDKRPQLADLRDSGSIEQDADIVMFVYREAYYKARQEPKLDTPEHEKWTQEMEQIRDKAEIIVAKHRNGPIATIPLFFDSNLTKFGNLPSN